MHQLRVLWRRSIRFDVVVLRGFAEFDWLVFTMVILIASACFFGPFDAAHADSCFVAHVQFATCSIILKMYFDDALRQTDRIGSGIQNVL